MGALQQGAGGLGSAHRSWSTTATQLQTGASPKLACGYPSPVPAILLNLQHSCGKSREADNSLKQLLFARQQGDLKLETKLAARHPGAVQAQQLNLHAGAIFASNTSDRDVEL